MKYIQNQDPILPEILRQNGGTTPMRFVDYVRFLTENHAGFDANMKALRASIRIQTAAAELEKRGLMVLEDADYELLRQANEAPSNGYPGAPGVRGDKPVFFSFARDLLPFIEAIESAPSEQPAPEIAADKAAE